MAEEATKQDTDEPAGLTAVAYRYLPILEWLPAYKRAWLTPDAIAAFTVWALLVPEAMGYASLAGMPPETGLYAAPLALLAYAIFGTSRQLLVGPSSTVAILSFSTVSVLADQGSEEFIALTIMLALIVGAIFVVCGVARLGWVSDFMAKPVLDGFIIGLALTVALGQLDKIFGVEATGENFWAELGDLISNLGDTHLETVLVGLGALALLFIMAKYTPRLPGALIVVVLGILVVQLFDLEARGVHVIGDIPAGLPDFGLPDFSMIEGSQVLELLPGAFGIVLVGYAESVAIARKYATKHKYDVDPNQELIAVGMANLGSGFSGAFVVDGSLSRTAAGDTSGQKSQMASLIGVVLVLVTLVAFTWLFEDLPEAILAAIVIHAVWHLIDFNKFREFYRVSPSTALVAGACTMGVLTVDILGGLIMAIVLSLGIVIYRASRPNIPRLGKNPDEDVYRDMDEDPENQPVPGLVILRIDAELFFANAQHFRDRVRQLIDEAEPPARAVLIDAEAVYRLDLTAAEMLKELATELEDEGIQLLFARVKHPVREMMRRSGVEEAVGSTDFFLTVSAGVGEYQRRHPEGRTQEVT